MDQDQPTGSGPQNATAAAEAEETRLRTRRLMFMSRGFIMALAGAFICAVAGLGWVVNDFPAVRAYAVPLGAIAGLALGLLHLGIERARARSACHVRTLRPATLRENLVLAATISSGVLALVLLDECLPDSFNRDWVWLAFLALMGGGFSGYFLFLAKRLRLFEPALLGLGMLAFSATGLCAHFVPLEKVDVEMLLVGFEAGFGILLMVLGVSLHRRWTAWRVQALEASGEEQA
jgi:hypothetical protein